jgi:outer membrane immunogenic protein
MKHFILGATLLLICSISSAQSYLQNEVDQINVGFGFSSWGLPVYIGYDHGVNNDVTFGLEASFRSYNEHYGDFKYNHSIIGFSGNGNYHFNRLLEIPSDFDFYAGLNLGFYVWSSPNSYNGKNSSGLSLGAQVGGRYFFSSKAGINLEIGGGNAFSGGKIGLTIKI